MLNNINIVVPNKIAIDVRPHDIDINVFNYNAKNINGKNKG